MNKQTKIILLVGAGVFAAWYFGLFDKLRSGGSSADQNTVGGKYGEYAQVMQGLANNATGNTVNLHSALTESVHSSLGQIAQWGQQAYENKRNTDNEEFAQWLQIMNSY